MPDDFTPTQAEINLCRRIRALTRGQHLAILTIDANGFESITFLSTGKEEFVRPKANGAKADREGTAPAMQS